MSYDPMKALLAEVARQAADIAAERAREHLSGATHPGQGGSAGAARGESAGTEAAQQPPPWPHPDLRYVGARERVTMLYPCPCQGWIVVHLHPKSGQRSDVVEHVQTLADTGMQWDAVRDDLRLAWGELHVRWRTMGDELSGFGGLRHEG